MMIKVQPPIIPRRYVRQPSRQVTVLGLDLKDAREEIFVRMVCDGLALGIAYARAGFKSKHTNAPALLMALPRVQERAAAILEARRTQGVVTLSEVTDMLQRVFAGAHSVGEYSAAHNAAFSLARLYGHVTDKSTLEVIRRPSRDPDAPSEQALEAWAASLPVVSGPGPEALIPGPSEEPSEKALEGPPRGAPAAPIGGGPQGPGLEGLSNDINWLEDVSRSPGGTGNGAPVAAVTGTPDSGGGSELLGPNSGGGSELLGAAEVPGPKQKRVPRKLQKGTSTTRGKKSKKRKLSPRGQSVKKPRTRFPPPEDLF